MPRLQVQVSPSPQALARQKARHSLALPPDIGEALMAIRDELSSELGVRMTRAQVVMYLITQYERNRQ